jgi:hypothetical protein
MSTREGGVPTQDEEERARAAGTTPDQDGKCASSSTTLVVLIQQEADSSAILQLEVHRLACVCFWLMEIVPKQGLLSMLKAWLIAVSRTKRSDSPRAVVVCLLLL